MDGKAMMLNQKSSMERNTVIYIRQTALGDGI